MSGTRFHAIAPYLLVEDVERSLAFYRDRLGFRVAGSVGKPPVFAIVIRDSVEIMLKRGEPEELERQRQWQAAVLPGDSAWQAYITLSGIEEYFQSCLPAGVTMRRTLCQTDYGMSEFEIVDPDGHVLCFGEQTKA
jgi:catechol 2,3-dioxygenase-like lactoylglutathione lyase family enzyme